MSESDPMCTVHMKSAHSRGQWVEIGRTERIKNSKNPEWTARLELEYYFEEKQELVFKVWDTDGKSSMDHIGDVSCSLGQIVGEGGGAFTKNIEKEGKGKRGVFHVSAEEMSPKASGTVRCHFRADGLDKKDWFGKSDP
jgi:hypothetical protein